MGIRLPSTLIFDYPTPAALCQHVTDLVHHHRDGAPAAALAPQVTPASMAAPAAVGGASRRLAGVMAAVHRLPGGRNIDDAPQTVAADSAAVLPLTRWEVDPSAGDTDIKVSRAALSTQSRRRRIPDADVGMW